MAKKKPGAALATSTVIVTPMRISPPGSNNLECDFSGPLVTGNTLFLSLNTEYDITFNVDAGAGYTFDSKKPFCNQEKRCPPELPGGTVQKPCKVTKMGSTSIQVHVASVGNRTVTYFRLNFDGSYTCDPIIVNN